MFRKQKLLFCAAFFFFALMRTEKLRADHFQVYLLAGQSNATGRAGSSELPQKLQESQKNVRFYVGFKDDKATLPVNTWEDLQPGSGGLGVGQTGEPFGPEITFGQRLADLSPDQKIAIIKYAKGGTNLAEDWSPDNSLYKGFVTTVNKALQGLTRAGHSYELRGIAWVQGERDTREIQHAEAYENNLKNFISRVRKDLFSGEDAPFVIAQLSDHQAAYDPQLRSIVQTAQTNVAASINKVAIVNTTSFGAKAILSDGAHYGPSGQQLLGNALADTIHAMDQKIPPTASSGSAVR